MKSLKRMFTIKCVLYCYCYKMLPLAPTTQLNVAVTAESRMFSQTVLVTGECRLGVQSFGKGWWLDYTCMSLRHSKATTNIRWRLPSIIISCVGLCLAHNYSHIRHKTHIQYTWKTIISICIYISILYLLISIWDILYAIVLKLLLNNCT